MATRKLEKDQESSTLNARRSARQAIRKHHRAELMVPFLTDINFVIFWPHCFHAHPELYEQWDANSLVAFHVTYFLWYWLANEQVDQLMASSRRRSWKPEIPEELQLRCQQFGG